MPKPINQFQKIYRQLNPAQKKAVDAIEGPVMVIAGPGTGKTQVLAARIANILLKTDTLPESILALTFTESAAKNMRQRLVDMIGTTGYYVRITTFHSFCREIINTYPEYFPIDRSSEPLSNLERYQLFQSLIDELDLDLLQPLNAPYFYLRDIIKSISDLKREGISPKQFKKIVKAEGKSLEQLTQERANSATRKKNITQTELVKRQKQYAKNHELSLVFQTYQVRLRESQRFDFDDMISLVIEALDTRQELLREYQENLHYFLVDEYQDTNSAQNRVVDLLASYWGDQANVFTVGDPNQAIYRFQGASLENILQFVKNYPLAKIINLDIGYRCPQNIYDTAAELIKVNHLSLGDKRASNHQLNLTLQLKSPRSATKPIKLFVAPSQVLESVYVAEEIKQLVAKGVDPDQIAVLFRHNADRVEIATALDKWHIRYEIEGGGDVLQEESVRQLLTLFAVIDQLRRGEDDEKLFEVMQYEWFSTALQLDQLLAMQVARAAGRAKATIPDLISRGYEVFNQYHVGIDITPLEFASLEKLIEQLREWSILDARLTFNEWFEKVINQSGFLNWVLTSQSKAYLITSLNSLFSEIKKLTSRHHGFKLADFLRAVAVLQEHNLVIEMEDLNVRRQAVHLSTVHKAKGREWDYVFLLRCLDKKWGNNRARDLIKLPQEILQNTDLSRKERNEDERRLFYVALTRVKKAAYITYPETITLDNRTREVVGSMFIKEIQDFQGKRLLLKETQADHILQQADDYLVKLMQPQIVRTATISEKEYFSHLVDRFKLSVTALNNYLRDPQEFVYNSLLKIPRAKPMPMMFGSAIHTALEKFHKYFQVHGQRPDTNKVVVDFKESLEKEVISPEDLSKRLKYGRQILTQYLEYYQDERVNPLFVEKFFGFGASKTMLGDIALSGRIDRIDWLDMKEKTVTVIDYKTGRAKSINEIEGKTISSNLSQREQALSANIRGPYKRQLLFYKLLTKLDRSFPYKVEQGTFDFIEPNKQSGKLVRRTFELKDEDVEDLKSLIIEVMSEIKDLTFLELL